MRMLFGLILGGCLGTGITALAYEGMRGDPAPVYHVAPPDRVALSRVEGEALEARRGARQASADVARLLVMVDELERANAALRVRLDERRRLEVVLPGRDVPAGDLIPVQNLPTRP